MEELGAADMATAVAVGPHPVAASGGGVGLAGAGRHVAAADALRRRRARSPSDRAARRLGRIRDPDPRDPRRRHVPADRDEDLDLERAPEADRYLVFAARPGRRSRRDRGLPRRRACPASASAPTRRRWASAPVRRPSSCSRTRSSRPRSPRRGRTATGSRCPRWPRRDLDRGRLCRIARSALEQAISATCATGKRSGRRCRSSRGCGSCWPRWHATAEAARALTRQAAAAKDRGDPLAVPSSLAKWTASDTAMRVATEAVQLFGASGYSRETGIERLMRDAKAPRSTGDEPDPPADRRGRAARPVGLAPAGSGRPIRDVTTASTRGGAVVWPVTADRNSSCANETSVASALWRGRWRSAGRHAAARSRRTGPWAELADRHAVDDGFEAAGLDDEEAVARLALSTTSAPAVTWTSSSRPARSSIVVSWSGRKNATPRRRRSSRSGPRPHRRRAGPTAS